MNNGIYESELGSSSTKSVIDIRDGWVKDPSNWIIIKYRDD